MRWAMWMGVLVTGLLMGSAAAEQELEGGEAMDLANKEATDGAVEAPAESVSGRRSGRERPADRFSEQYGVLLETNIFQRDRRPQEQPAAPQQRETAPVRRTPEQSVRLTGIVFEEGRYRAYFENMDAQSPSVTRVYAGEAIARGHVREILIDAVAYASGDEDVIWIGIGQDLTGAAARAGGVSRSGPASGDSAHLAE